LGPLVEGTHCLDLFAGVGSYGLEALSRGAQSVTFVEKSRRLIPIIEANIQATQKSLNAAPPPATSVLCLDALTWQSPKTFGLIFADPPYALLEKEGQRILKQLERLLAPAPHARLILEAPGNWHPPENIPFTELKRLARGPHNPTAIIYRYAPLTPQEP
tara:strand:- start:4812 stop:5291 length:480 start_codon:yes stop_codon:yes gene_type:complete